jgi:hypothetical protein
VSGENVANAFCDELTAKVRTALWDCSSACQHGVVAVQPLRLTSTDTCTRETPCDALDQLYFSGYAMWTYLTAPFSLSWSGFRGN